MALRFHEAKRCFELDVEAAGTRGTGVSSEEHNLWVEISSFDKKYFEKRYF